jgi:hypothetical protein
LEFHGVSTLKKWKAEQESPDIRGLVASVNRYSNPGSYAYVWSPEGSVYDAIERVPASRYIESHWLTGEIYGAQDGIASRISPNWILPGAWSNWQADMHRTPPVVVVVPEGYPIGAYPLLARFITTSYVPAYQNSSYMMFVRKKSPKLPSGGGARLHARFVV